MYILPVVAKCVWPIMLYAYTMCHNQHTPRFHWRDLW